MRISKEKAIARLVNAGWHEIATVLEQWRNKDGRNWGWNGFIKKYAKRFRVLETLRVIWM
ncbi:hypothetical protein [Brevibacillus sp. AY1]|uniref:hypothetical protein n=1 Tax=Brevibacillus sp. AY1 TaxID=2807621 RepID=UPI0024590C9C|nr:hypothetical protein [Brevibacillus sp. AY1]MDH4620025.1 hypothetical protein [Brevibacillus sp. AY1]